MLERQRFRRRRPPSPTRSRRRPPTPTHPTDTEAPADTGLTGEGLAVGVIAPSQGLLTTLFQGQTRGIDFAVEDIADGGGVLDGPLDVTTTQTPLDGIDADVVPTVVDEGAQALIGPTGSTGGTEYRDAVAEADSISCSASASVPGLTSGQETFGLFRTALPDDVLVSYLADTIIARRDAEAPGDAWKVAIVARSDDYGLAVGNGLASSLQSRGLDPERGRLQPTAGALHRSRPRGHRSRPRSHGDRVVRGRRGRSSPSWSAAASTRRR